MKSLNSPHQPVGFLGRSSDPSFSLLLPPQAMRFGDLPSWAADLSGLIQEAAALPDAESHPIPGHLLWRDPLFDQLIVNVYAPGEVRNVPPTPTTRASPLGA